MRDVFAIGDCATIEGQPPLPATAQVANQKADWLAKRLNQNDLSSVRFSFRNQGIMAYIGGWRAIAQLGNDEGQLSGRAAWVALRSAVRGAFATSRTVALLFPSFFFFFFQSLSSVSPSSILHSSWWQWDSNAPNLLGKGTWQSIRRTLSRSHDQGDHQSFFHRDWCHLWQHHIRGCRRNRHGFQW